MAYVKAAIAMTLHWCIYIKVIWRLHSFQMGSFLKDFYWQAHCAVPLQ